MNNEIKELLAFKENADYKKLSCDEIKVLRDYITNLEQENEKWWAIIKDYEMDLHDLWFKNNELEERIEKAVEYGNSCINKDLDLETLDEPYKTTFKTAYEIHNNYLDILNGRSDE